jgi:hypothetical protein
LRAGGWAIGGEGGGDCAVDCGRVAASRLGESMGIGIVETYTVAVEVTVEQVIV